MPVIGNLIIDRSLGHVIYFGSWRHMSKTKDGDREKETYRYGSRERGCRKPVLSNLAGRDR